jgi:SAM-dependent methyltransferase
VSVHCEGDESCDATMPRHSPFSTQMPAQITSPSRLLLRLGQAFSRAFPLLDAGCGAGRNAIALAQLGLTVVCADRNEQRLAELVEIPLINGVRRALVPICADLESATWPFGVSCFSAIVCVHYLDVALSLPFILHSFPVAISTLRR